MAGLGKGHLVREIDALDGMMGRVADAAGIQFRLLNRRKGPAVRGPRTQADRKLYAAAMQQAIAEQRTARCRSRRRSRTLKSWMAGLSRSSWLTGSEFACGAVVLTTGTFLRGLIHIGERKIVAGRMNEKARWACRRRWRAQGFRLGRLKTGTPPRLDGRTIDWASLGDAGR